MNSLRWFNPQLPQMLQGAILFSYLNGAVALINLLSGASQMTLLLLVAAGGAVGIANEKKAGYWVALVCAAVFFCLNLALLFLSPFIFSSLLSLLFSGFMMALLLHPISRSYERLYFR